MKSIVHHFDADTFAVVVAAAPSGARWIVNSLHTTAGTATIKHGSSSGLIAAVASTAGIEGVVLYPSGDTGWNESIAIHASGTPATVTLGYSLQAPIGEINQHSLQHQVREYFTSSSGHVGKWF